MNQLISLLVRSNIRKVNVVYMIYTDELILARTHKYEVDQTIQDIQNANLKYFLGINLDSRQYRSIQPTQPHLIYRISEEIKMG